MTANLWTALSSMLTSPLVCIGLGLTGAALLAVGVHEFAQRGDDALADLDDDDLYARLLDDAEWARIEAVIHAADFDAWTAEMEETA